MGDQQGESQRWNKELLKNSIDDCFIKCQIWIQHCMIHVTVCISNFWFYFFSENSKNELNISPKKNLINLRKISDDFFLHLRDKNEIILAMTCERGMCLVRECLEWWKRLNIEFDTALIYNLIRKLIVNEIPATPSAHTCFGVFNFIYCDHFSEFVKIQLVLLLLLFIKHLIVFFF